jgi:hypothetical protein
LIANSTWNEENPPTISGIVNSHGFTLARPLDNRSRIPSNDARTTESTNVYAIKRVSVVRSERHAADLPLLFSFLYQSGKSLFPTVSPHFE